MSTMEENHVNTDDKTLYEKFAEHELTNGLLEFSDILDNISDTLSEQEGQDVADFHNKLCSQPIKYIGDSTWQYIEETP